MRLPRLLPACCLCAGLCAQDAWTELLDRRERSPEGQPRWLLAWMGTASQVQLEDDTILRLLVSRELLFQPLPAPARQALLARPGLSAQTLWVLVNPEGELVAKGTEMPRGPQILEPLSAAGFQPRWLRRQEFLRQHPEQGEALKEELGEILNRTHGKLIQARMAKRLPTGTPEQFLPGCEIPNTSEGEAFASTLLREARDPMTRLLDLPEASPWIIGPAVIWPSQLWTLGAGLAPDWRDLQDRFLDRLLRNLEADPENPFLPFALSGFGSEVLSRMKALAQSRQTDPDRPWPPVGLFAGVRFFANRVSESELLAYLDQIPMPPPNDGGDPAAWKAHREARQQWVNARLFLQVRQERWGEAARSLAELRELGGQRLSPRDLSSRLSAKALQQGEIKAILELPPAPDPVPPPAPPPLRLVLLGPSPWLKSWLDLKEHPALATWGPDELRWEVASAGEAEGLRTNQAWDPAPRWVLLRGKAVLDSGLECPNGETLAQRLAAQGPNRLQRLGAYLERHPGHRDVRRRRLWRLRERMPNPSLEPLLTEDARLLGEEADLGPVAGWTPDSATWQWAAQQVLPVLESTLEHWPGSAATWRGWIAWSALHPARPSALGLVQRLSLWGEPGTWASQLPKEVHLAVAAELRRQGRFEEMRSWFQAAWDALDHRPYQDLPQFQRSWRLRQAKDWEEGILKPLREALQVQRRDADLVALERTWGRMTGREAK